MKDPKAKAHQQFSLAIEAANHANLRFQELRRAMQGAAARITPEFVEAMRNLQEANRRVRVFGAAALHG